jgi:dTDP-4-dehydrorhamnose 3,5-epimerase
MEPGFRSGRIDDVLWYPLKRYLDHRGWLCELFRHDEIPEEFHPAMAYISMTESGVARGPHEHVDQADYFCFLGPSNFKLYMWDNRRSSSTYRVKQVEVVGQDNPVAVIIPAGIVHAYQNIGSEPGIVFNCPNRLYRGHGRRQPVDEIRHEDQPRSPFQMD